MHLRGPGKSHLIADFWKIDNVSARKDRGHMRGLMAEEPGGASELATLGDWQPGRSEPGQSVRAYPAVIASDLEGRPCVLARGGMDLSGHQCRAGDRGHGVARADRASTAGTGAVCDLDRADDGHARQRAGVALPDHRWTPRFPRRRLCHAVGAGAGRRARSRLASRRCRYRAVARCIRRSASTPCSSPGSACR
jgi:hypothetical protein